MSILKNRQKYDQTKKKIIINLISNKISLSVYIFKLIEIINPKSSTGNYFKFYH